MVNYPSFYLTFVTDNQPGSAKLLTLPTPVIIRLLSSQFGPANTYRQIDKIWPTQKQNKAKRAKCLEVFYQIKLHVLGVPVNGLQFFSCEVWLMRTLLNGECCRVCLVRSLRKLQFQGVVWCCYHLLDCGGAGWVILPILPCDSCNTLEPGNIKTLITFQLQRQHSLLVT